MKATILSEFGGPEYFSVGELPTPEPENDQMLIEVAACGVCGHDLLNRAGHFPHTRTPSVMGHEIAGTVVSVGALVSRFTVDDRIALVQRISCGSCNLCRSGRENLCKAGPGFYGEDILGGYGEYVIASERNSVRVPDSVPLDVAAVLSCAIGTGFHALRRARLTLGDTVLVTGASGGVGIHTVKLARLMGMKVIAVSSSAAKSQRLYDAGADEVVVSPELSFHEQVRDLSTGEGVDAVIEIVGQASFKSSIKCLKAGGRMVVVGTVDPGVFPLNPALAILKEIELIGSAHATLADLEMIMKLVERGRIVPEIADRLPQASAGEAHSLMEERKTFGRVVLLNKKTGR